VVRSGPVVRGRAQGSSGTRTPIRSIRNVVPAAHAVERGRSRRVSGHARVVTIDGAASRPNSGHTHVMRPGPPTSRRESCQVRIRALRAPSGDAQPRNARLG
jgi:hypothetical protein